MLNSPGGYAEEKPQFAKQLQPRAQNICNPGRKESAIQTQGKIQSAKPGKRQSAKYLQSSCKNNVLVSVKYCSRLSIS